MTEGSSAASKAESVDAPTTEATADDLKRVQQMKTRFISGDFIEARRLAQEELTGMKCEVRRCLDEWMDGLERLFDLW